MLDELDALMDRMLTLPVNDLDDAPSPPAIVRMPAMSATLTVLEEPADEKSRRKNTGKSARKAGAASRAGTGFCKRVPQLHDRV